MIIVMTYYNRQEQLNRTLESFKQYDPDSFKVVIVDDMSDLPVKIPDVKFDVTVLTTKNKTWVQSTPVWNIGFKYALQDDPEIIVMQNAECYHDGNILGYAKKGADDRMISFGCYSQNKEGKVSMNNRAARFDGDDGWYNHPVYRPCAYHFCNAITGKNLKKLNGFDERLSFGIGRDDAYFIDQVKTLGLQIEITEAPFVVHQWHYSGIPRPDKAELIEKNKAIYNELIKEKTYKAKHLITPDL